MLEGKVVWVTGAAQGIGAAFARGLAQAGASVVVSDVASGARTMREVEEAGGRALDAPADVTDEAACHRAVAAALERFGRLDAVLCNAALFATLPLRKIEDIPVDEWDRVMAVNVRGVFLTVREALPALRAAGGGSIVAVSSNLGLTGSPRFLHYNASKGAVLTMVKSLAHELGPDRIRVNAIAPGFTLSEQALQRPSADAARALSIERRALKRDQLPDDLVGAALFLLGDASAFVTGQTLVVDGGSHMH